VCVCVYESEHTQNNGRVHLDSSVGPGKPPRERRLFAGGGVHSKHRRQLEKVAQCGVRSPRRLHAEPEHAHLRRCEPLLPLRLGAGGVPSRPGTLRTASPCRRRVDQLDVRFRAATGSPLPVLIPKQLGRTSGSGRISPSSWLPTERERERERERQNLTLEPAVDAERLFADARLAWALRRRSVVRSRRWPHGARGVRRLAVHGLPQVAPVGRLVVTSSRVSQGLFLSTCGERRTALEKSPQLRAGAVGADATGRRDYDACPASQLTQEIRTASSDEKVANRDTKVWHGATENGS
jgi:hypothetical protein